MSLKIHTELATDLQKQMLKKLEYYGTMNLTKQEASQLIDEIITQNKLHAKQPEALYYERIKHING